MISQKYFMLKKTSEVPYWQQQVHDVTSSTTSGGLAAAIASAAAWRAASISSGNIN